MVRSSVARLLCSLGVGGQKGFGLLVVVVLLLPLLPRF
jgi:hypothetical protein